MNNMRLGWHLSKKEVACDISPENSIVYHTAILAQSGSGKSFFLGRLIEEILLTTLSKVIIIDPNGDFRYFSEVGSNEKIWNNKGVKEWLYRDDNDDNSDKNTSISLRDKKSHFSCLWKKIKFSLITCSDEEKPKELIVQKPYIHWRREKEEDKAVSLGFSKTDSPEEQNLLSEYIDYLENILQKKKYAYRDFSEEFSAYVEKKKPDISSKAQAHFETAINELGEIIDFWATNDTNPDIKDMINYKDQPWRCCVLDLPSLSNEKSKMILVNICLDKIWQIAENQWDEALRSEDQDVRIPIFIVFDEAHNIFSSDEDDVLKRSIHRKIQRIAAEGRKYGLFLILSTQRPSKIPEDLLSECENICLLRLNSIVERSKVSDIWGIPKESLNQARFFLEKGELILFGRWVPSLVAIHASPRRTKEGGANLDKDFWAKVPEEFKRGYEKDKENGSKKPQDNKKAVKKEKVKK